MTDLISFLIGASVMVIELVGARLLTPMFGYSVLPWTATIATILGGVAVGNAWGGTISRAGTASTLRNLLVAAGVAALLPILRVPIGTFLADATGPGPGR